MKTIKDYILEKYEIEETNKFGGGYFTVTLVRRENLDLSTISKEDFIKFMLEDYKKAVEEYKPIVDKHNIKSRESYIENQVKAAIRFAEKKWKTDKKRQEYIENIRKNAEEYKIYLDDATRIFFDLKPDKGEMGINNSCIISSDSNEKSLENCYEIMQKSKYFKKGTGWAFKYDSSNRENPRYAFRPYIDILLNESDRAEQQRDAENLSKSVEDFYKNTNYWGD